MKRAGPGFEEDCDHSNAFEYYYFFIMLCQFDLNKFWNERVNPRKQAASSRLRDIMVILSELLRDVEQHEPRFVGTLNEVDGRIEGLQVI